MQVLKTWFSLAPDPSCTSRIARLVGVIREWANKNFREEEPRPDSFLERFRGPELQTVTTQQGDGKSDKDGEGKGTKYSCPACGIGRALNHAVKRAWWNFLCHHQRQSSTYTKPCHGRKRGGEGRSTVILSLEHFHCLSTAFPTAISLLAVRTPGGFSHLSCSLPDFLLLCMKQVARACGRDWLQTLFQQSVDAEEGAVRQCR